MNEATAVGEATGGLSEMERVADTFVAPSKTFMDIRRNASWWAPFLLMLVFSLTSAFVVGNKVGWDRVSENQVQLSPKAQDRLSQLTPEQRASQMAVSAKITKVITYCFPIVLLIILALYALVIWASFNFGLGATTTYNQVLAVTWYASLPFLISSVLGIITVQFGGNADEYNIRNPVGTNLGYYFTDAGPVVKAFLTQLDVVRLWSVVLTIMGMAIVARKTIMQSAAVILAWWAIGVILSVVGAAFS